MVDRVEDQEKCVHPDEEAPVVDDLIVARKKPGRRRREEDQHRGDGKCHADRHLKRPDRSPVRPVDPGRPDVLADKGRRGLPQRVDRQENERIELVVGPPPGHAAGAEAVDVGLDKDVGDRGDHGLNARRKADLHDKFENRKVDPKIVPGELIDVVRPGEQDKDHDRGDELRDDRRDRSARDAGLEDDDEDEIEDRVQDAREDQEIERPLRVPHRAQDAAAHVVDEEAQGTRKINFQVQFGLREHILRRLHEAQHEGHEEESRKCEEDAEQDRHGDGRLDGPVEFFHFPGAEVLADHHASADGEPIEKEDHDVDDHGRRADGRQGLLADEVADDDGVHRVVEHLEDVPQKERHGKCNQMGGDGAVRHIPDGGFFKFWHVSSTILLKRVFAK